MKAIHFLFCLLSCCPITTVAPVHPDSFEKTKAEDNDYTLPQDMPHLITPCDLTSHTCDLNCCSDEDCSVEEKRSFICSDDTTHRPSHFNYLDCENISVLSSIGDPLMCLHSHNSPYLGEFYINNDNFSDQNFFQILTSRNRAIFSFKIINSSNNESKFKYGSNLFFLDSVGQIHLLNIPVNILSKGNGYCSKAPIRFLINEMSNCYILMNEEQCLLNYDLHLQQVINNLNRIQYLGGINGINVTHKLVCLKNGTDYLLPPKNYLNSQKDKSFNIDYSTECANDISTKINKIHKLCENVIVGMDYIILINGTDLLEIEVTIYTANIPYTVGGFISLHNESLDHHLISENGPIYTSQKISVTFNDVSEPHLLSNQGYAPGQPIYSSR